MRAQVSRVLRDQLGDEPTDALVAYVDAAGEEWKRDVLSLAAERFERRLVEEMAALRVEMAAMGAAIRGEIAAMGAAIRGEMAQQRATIREEMAAMGAAIRGEIAAGRVELLKWCFLFWIGQVAAMAALLAFMLRGR